MWDQWLIVIPARLKSTRLPEKPLADLAGKPLIIRVYERLLPLVQRGAEVVVATDSDKIMAACATAGVRAVMTREDHVSGTARCHEVAEKLPPKKFVMNVQGDEPFVNTDDLTRLNEAMQEPNAPPMGTLVYENHDGKEFQNPNCVKTLRDKGGKAIYFSRSPIPYHRGESFKSFLQHVGVYAFRREALTQFCQWPASRLEVLESLEQLRAIDNGMPIVLVNAQHPSIGIDTPEDLQHARKKF